MNNLMDQSNKAKKVRTTSNGWMIQRIAKRLNDRMEQRLAVLDLSTQHFPVMMTVLENDGLTQTEIGGKFGMPSYAISRALDHLEAKGALERRQHPTSRRTHTIHATEVGQKLAPQLFEIVRLLNEELVSDLSVQEREMFQKILTKLV